MLDNYLQARLTPDFRHVAAKRQRQLWFICLYGDIRHIASMERFAYRPKLCHAG